MSHPLDFKVEVSSRPSPFEDAETLQSMSWDDEEELENGALLQPLLSQPTPYTRHRAVPFWRRWLARLGWSLDQQGQVPTAPSGMFAIVPLDDSRLQPRRPLLRWSITSALVLVLLVIVFLLVPRGVTLGTPQFMPFDFHRNRTEGTYQLKLDVRLPVFNNNFYRARIHGQFHVLFYEVLAGQNVIKFDAVPARMQGKALELKLDASNVPAEYGLSIVRICRIYPGQLMFIFRAELSAHTMFGTQRLPDIDTYFLVDCGN